MGEPDAATPFALTFSGGLGAELTLERLRERAGDANYAAGRHYFDRGAVTDITADRESLTAVVNRSGRCDVAITLEGGEVVHTCTCALYTRTAAFCPHCVAAAIYYGKMSVARAGGSRSSTLASQKRSTKAGKPGDLRDYLRTLDSGALADLIIARAGTDIEWRK